MEEQKEKKIYTRKCPWCKKEFKSTARNQRYCSSECGKKYNKRRKDSKSKYNENAGLFRLKARAHALAVETLNQLVELGLRKRKCTVCGETENLEVHHKNLVWLDNTPSNLEYRCKKHHAQAHSELEKSLDERGILVDEYYEESFLPLARITNKKR